MDISYAHVCETYMKRVVKRHDLPKQDRPILGAYFM